MDLKKMYNSAGAEDRKALRKMAGKMEDGDEKSALLKAMDEMDEESVEKSLTGETESRFDADALAAFVKSMDPAEDPEPEPVDLTAGTLLALGDDFEGVDPEGDEPLDAAPILKSLEAALGTANANSAIARKGVVALAMRLDAVSKSLVKSQAGSAALKAEMAAIKAQGDALQKSMDAIATALRLPVPSRVTTTAADVVPTPADARENANGEFLPAHVAEPALAKALAEADAKGDALRANTIRGLILPASRGTLRADLAKSLNII